MPSTKSRRHYQQWIVAEQAVEAALEHLPLVDAGHRTEERLETLMLTFLGYSRERYHAFIERCADADQELRLSSLKSALAFYLWYVCGALLTRKSGIKAVQAFLQSGSTVALEAHLSDHRLSWTTRCRRILARYVRLRQMGTA